MKCRGAVMRGLRETKIGLALSSGNFKNHSTLNQQFKLNIESRAKHQFGHYWFYIGSQALKACFHGE
jgi:hypothetical protein